MGKKLEATLAILNGAIGDYLVRTGNGLATTMALVPQIGGDSLRLERDSLARAYPAASGRVALLVHGLMVTEGIWEMADGSDYGVRLARELGYTPVYVRYNSGLAIADNGAHLSAALDAFASQYPVPIEEIVPVGYSMGGLVVRSACHVASLGKRPPKENWLSLVHRAIYVGTPHLGAPLERVGRTVAKVLRGIPDPYTQLIGAIADMRSDGVKDLGDAPLRHEDRGSPAARGPGVNLRDPRHPVPLLPQIEHYLVAGGLSDETSLPAALAALFGDALVPLQSATGGFVEPAGDANEPLPASHVKVLAGLYHLMLARDPQVYEAIRAWCE